ncbi:MAG TPA: MBL fold metallo-hydrolase [Hyphomonadaceae bacterium]|nr:MBL fold metallo-hydrolase [Hyphomonadaceae bacterium]HPI47050.1 MBL fold metallo-hydrolase [Hyphomonadaceae bacterium]
MRIVLLAGVAALALAACTTTEAAAPTAPAATAAAAAAPAPPAATTPAPNTQPFARVVDLGQGVSMLIGQGGNLGLSVGDDGVFLIDDQYATNAVANLAKIEEHAKGKPKYLINTHWHFDHAGGNEVFGKAGATIFASDNVRKRLTGEVPSVSRGAPQVPAPKIALPVVTFVEGIDFHLNGQTIRAIRAPLPAHTDGDTLIYFVEADVLHTGDTYMKDRYPFVDTGSGGTQAGFIAAIEKAVQIAGPNTKVIPGHGELATEADLQAALDMHKGARAAVEALVKSGKTLEQAVAAKPLAQWTPRFGQGGFISEDAYVTVIYNELKK